MRALVARAGFAARGESYWASILILLPLVFQRLFIGGTTGGYEEYAGFSFAWIGYVIHFLFIFQYLFLRSPTEGLRVLLGIIILTLVSCAQLYTSLTIFRFSLLEIALPFFRAIMWLFAVAIYAEQYFEPENFKRAFLELMTAAAIFILFCALFNAVTGIPLGVNIEKGLPRAHGTFSEPSTLSSVYPGLAVYGLATRRYAVAIVSAVVLAVSASVIATGTTIIALALFLTRKWPSAASIVIFSVITFAVIMTLAVSPTAVSFISGATGATTDFLDATIGQSEFRAYTVDRLITAINDLAFYLNSGALIDIEESGGLARFVGAMMLLENMRIDGTTWLGYGLSIYGFVANQLYDTSLDFGLYPYLLSSFGIFVGTGLIYLIGHRVVRIAREDNDLFLIFSASLIGTIYNSGGGIMAYSLPVLAFLRHLARRPVRYPAAPPSEAQRA